MADQFKTQGKYAIESLMWYLWENPQYFDWFVNDFVINECEIAF